MFGSFRVEFEGSLMNPSIQHDMMSSVRIPGTAFEVSAFTHIGGRRTQEDRFTICPSLGSTGACGFGLFDGTAGVMGMMGIEPGSCPGFGYRSALNDVETSRLSASEPYCAVDILFRGLRSRECEATSVRSSGTYKGME